MALLWTTASYWAGHEDTRLIPSGWIEAPRCFRCLRFFPYGEAGTPELRWSNDMLDGIL